MHCWAALLTVIFTFVLTKNANSQIRPAGDTLKLATDTIQLDSASLSNDTLAADSTVKINDSLAKRNLEDSLGIRISPDALPSPVTSVASDSAVLDLENNLFYLYGNAQVNYEDLQLNASRIIYDQDSNLVTAAPAYDTTGIIGDRPSFQQGQEKFTYDSLQYNFQSKRAIVRNARTQYGEGFVHSIQVKRNPDQSIYGFRSVYTTCALDTPHFGIRARKIKVIPNKVIASGPANIAIEQVPTPLFLPFGLFPIAQGQRSGFKLPMYTIEDARGIGLINGGYYFAINDYVDLLVESNIYSRGSYTVSGISSYTNRYRYSGGVSLAYGYDKQGETFEPGSRVQRDFKVDWRHASDAKSRPGVGFNASVVFGTASYNENYSYAGSQIIQNQYSSNITYQKAWQNKPYSLSIGARHSQNLGTGQVEVNLPEINFFVSQFNPFQGKTSTGTRWYEKITASYNLSAMNRISFADSTFSFNTLALNDFENGIKHSIPISASYNVLRFITMNFGTSYNEYWLTRQTYHLYDPSIDTIRTNTYRGFFTARDFNASISANTKIFGLKMFKRGKVAGIRHVIYPTVSLTYLPDFAAAPFRYGYQTITDANTAPQYRSVYESSVIGAPAAQFGDFSSLLGFGFDNNLQMKVRTTKDTSGTKNIRLIDNFRISSTYDLAKDSFQWGNIAVGFATNLFNIFNITAHATFDPYDFDHVNNRRIDRTMWDAGKGLARFVNAGASVGGSLRSAPIEEDRPAEAQSEEFQRMMDYGRYNDYVDFNVPWNISFSYTMQVSKEYRRQPLRDTVRLDHSVMLGGDVNITPRWKLQVSSGYNFTQKQLQITQIDIYRDLHCWEMRLGTIPFGPRKNFTFTINVKAQILQDLKLIRRRDFRDAI